jgi:hypothetical protein
MNQRKKNAEAGEEVRLGATWRRCSSICATGQKHQRLQIDFDDSRWYSTLILNLVFSFQETLNLIASEILRTSTIGYRL